MEKVTLTAEGNAMEQKGDGREMEGRSRYVLSRGTEEPQKDERVTGEAAR